MQYRKEWGITKFREYLAKYNFDQQTINDFVEQWELGNRGEWGTWKSLNGQEQLFA